MLLPRLVVFSLALSGSLALFSARSDEPGARLSHALAADPAPFSTFDPNVVVAPQGSARRAVLDARASGAFDRAYALAIAGLVAEPAEAPLLRFMAAQIARERGLVPQAVDVLRPLAESEHPLALWARLNLAEWLEGTDPARGLTIIEPLLIATEDEVFPGLEAAQRVRGRLLAKLGRVDEAIAQLEASLGAMSDQGAAAQVALPLADLLAVRPDEEARVRALALYRRVAYRLPGTRLSRAAELSAAQVLATLPPKTRESLRKPAAEDVLARADALLADARFSDAERAYAALEAEPNLPPTLLCRARYGRAKLLLDRRARAEGAQRMADVAVQCDHDPDQRAWARYHAARAFSALAQNELAIHHYDALQAEAPEHRLADDALFRSAKVMRDMGNLDEARARLQSLPLRYPGGDMRSRARFALAWQVYAEGDAAGAAALLADASIEREDAEDLHGRAPYWHARFLAESGHESAAQAAFAALFLHTPLSYYGQQAFARLAASAPQRANELLQKLAAVKPSDLVFAADAALARPGFLRAVALLQVGDTALAMTELRTLGFLAESADSELHWLSVALFDRAGAHTLSVELARKRVFDLLQRAPKGRDLAFYRLAYPPAFAPMIEEACDKEQVPSAFVRAVAREESAFNPRAVSRAQAYGLIQIIEPTARMIARGLDLPTDTEALRRPDINLALGTRFINTLASGLRGQFALVPAAYNAGPGATQRWLSERASEPLDVWIENVPYDETRHYTRRVLQSYGIYAWLDSGTLLSLPAAL